MTHVELARQAAPVCPSCKGKGKKFRDRPCETCDGEGRLNVREITAAIDSAVSDESTACGDEAKKVEDAVQRALVLAQRNVRGIQSRRAGRIGTTGV